MAVKGVRLLAMLHDDEIAVAAEDIRIRDRPVVNCVDGPSLGKRELDPFRSGRALPPSDTHGRPHAGCSRREADASSPRGPSYTAARSGLRCQAAGVPPHSEERARASTPLPAAAARLRLRVRPSQALPA